jgi:hypothetical protein
MRKKMTKWFPVEITPVHVGVYETDLAGFLGYSFWTGKRWCDTAQRPEWATKRKGMQNKEWRGLKEKQA